MIGRMSLLLTLSNLNSGRLASVLYLRYCARSRVSLAESARMGAVAVESWGGLNVASRSRRSALERKVITAVESSHPNKSKSTTVAI